jgi:hypothetical protein
MHLKKRLKKQNTRLFLRVSPERQKAALGLVEESEKRASDNKKLQKQKQSYKDLQLPSGIENLQPNERLEYIKSSLEKQKDTDDLKKSPDRKLTYNKLGIPQEIADLEPKERQAYINNFIKQKSETTQATEFEKSRARLSAKKFEDSQDLYEKSKQSLSDIDRIDELAKKLSGPLGYINALTKGAASTEINALGLAALEPVIKIFNPVGAIPTQKINLLKEKFTPTASDLSSTIRGKTNALRRIAKKAEDRSLRQMRLYAEYNGTPPIDAIVKFNDESAKIFDNILKEESKNVSQNGSEELIFMRAPNGRKIQVPKSRVKEFQDQEAILI